MFRNWDNHDRYYDVNGNPLQGCLEFYVRGTSTKATVYDGDHVPLANPQLTDQLGRTDHQVFVDCDVTAKVYKYTGDGRFGNIVEDSIDTSAYTDNDNDSPVQYLWSLQYTVDSMMDAETVVNTSSAPAVMTMAELRSLDVAEVPNTDGVKVIALHGYYEAGDKAVVWYVWHGDATADDDNGSVIKSDLYQSGRWILVQPELVCDSRHFGVFPQDSAGAYVDHTTGIIQLVNYCNAKGLKPLFNGSPSKPYFIYNFLVASSRNPIVVSRGTLFVDKQHARFYGEWEGDPRFTNGMTTVSSSVIKASWNFEDAITYQTVYLDDTCQLNSFRNADVYVTVPTAGKSFTHCNIISDGCLANNSFSDCVLRGSMFTNESLSPVIDENCIIHPKDFHDRMALWCTLRSQQHEPVIDLEMETLDASCEIALDGVFFKDALFDGFTHSATVSVGFEGCRGSIVINALGNYAMTSEDSELNITFNGTGEAGVGFQPALNLHDGTISFVNNLTYLLALGGSGTALTGNAVLVNGDVALDNVNIGIPITLRGALDMRFCTMNSNMLHYTVNQIAQVRIEHSILNAFYSLTPAVSGTTVRGVWTHNYSSVDSPILIDRTNVDPIDSHHDYVYSNNSGGFIPYETKPAVHEFTIHHGTMTGSLQPPTVPYYLTQMVLGGSDSDTNGRPSGYILPWYSQPLFDTIRMFRIGMDRFQIKAKLLAWPQLLENEGTTGEYQYNRYHDALLGAYYIDGFTWGIMPFWDDPTVTPPTQLSTPANPRFFKGSLSFSFNNMPDNFSDYHVSMEIQYECLDKHEYTN